MAETLEIVIAILVIIAIGFFTYYLGKKIKDDEWVNKIEDIRKEAIKQSRAIIGGQMSEQIAPYLPNFKYKPTEIRFIGKPIDFIVFEGMDKKDIRKIIFIEVKSGKSTMSVHERKLRNTIKEGKVSWEEYRIPQELNADLDKKD